MARKQGSRTVNLIPTKIMAVVRYQNDDIYSLPQLICWITSPPTCSECNFVNMNIWFFSFAFKIKNIMLRGLWKPQYPYFRNIVPYHAHAASLLAKKQPLLMFSLLLRFASSLSLSLLLVSPNKFFSYRTGPCQETSFGFVSFRPPSIHHRQNPMPRSV